MMIQMRRVSNSTGPCEVCGRKNNKCAYNIITDRWHCFTHDSDVLGWTCTHVNSIGASVFRRDDDHAVICRHCHGEHASETCSFAVEVAKPSAASRSRDAEPSTKKKPQADRLRRAIAAAVEMPPKISKWFSRHLDVTEESLRAAGVRYIQRDGYRSPAFTWPEHVIDRATGQLVACSNHIRWENGSRVSVSVDLTTMPGRGLTVMTPSPNSDFILSPEGGSDSFAIFDLGLNSAARENNMGGGDKLADYIKSLPDADQKTVIFIAERDQKPDGHWPGKEGAEHAAAVCANQLGREVWIAFPPDPYKDVREWYIDQGGAVRDLEDRLELGARLLRHLIETAVVVQPAAEPTPETSPQPTAAELAAIQLPTDAALPPAVDIFSRAEHRLLTIDEIQRDLATQPDVIKGRLCCINRTGCQNPHGVLMQRFEDGVVQVAWFPCEHVDCPGCSKPKREQYKATIRHHLGNLISRRTPEATDPVYLFNVPGGDGPAGGDRTWTNVRERLGKLKINYFRLDPNGLRNFTVCSADKPSPRQVPPEQVIATHPAAAAEHLCKIVDAFPLMPGKKLFASSHTWPLLPDREPRIDPTDPEKKRRLPPKWKILGRISRGVAPHHIEKVLGHRGIKYEWVLRRERFFDWTAMQFKPPSADHKFHKLKGELEEGGLLYTDDEYQKRWRPRADGDLNGDGDGRDSGWAGDPEREFDVDMAAT